MGKNGKLRYEERNQLTDVALMPNTSGSYHYFHWIEQKSNHPLNASVMEIPYCNMDDYYAFYKMQISPLIYDRAKYTARQENNRIFLTVRHPTDDESIINTPCMNFRVLSSNILKSHFDTWTEPLTKESFDINPEQCRNAYCARITYIIDSTPERPFIYGYTIYDRNGKRKFSYQWKSVDFPKELDDSLFIVN